MKNKSNNREEEILNSIDGIIPAEAPPYFYTRVVARMQNELGDNREPFFLLRPVFLTASLSVMLVLNMIFFFQFNARQEPSPNQTNNAATIESFADAYNLNTTTVYE